MRYCGHDYNKKEEEEGEKNSMEMVRVGHDNGFFFLDSRREK